MQRDEKGTNPYGLAINGNRSNIHYYVCMFIANFENTREFRNKYNVTDKVEIILILIEFTRFSFDSSCRPK